MSETNTKRPETQAPEAPPKANLPAAPEAKAAPPAVVHDDGELSLFLDSGKFAQLWRVAQMFSRSDLVPQQYRGKIEDCMIAIHMASRMGMDPMMVMQNTYCVHGKPGMEAKLVIALVNMRGPFTGPIQWAFKGAGINRECMAYATHRQTSERCEAVVSWTMVKAEGWADKDGSKWQTMADQMFCYRSAVFLARRYCPEVLMGMYTTDELQDIGPPGEAELIEQVKAKSAARLEDMKTKLANGQEPNGMPESPSEPDDAETLEWLGKTWEGHYLSEAEQADPPRGWQGKAALALKRFRKENPEMSVSEIIKQVEAGNIMPGIV